MLAPVGAFGDPAAEEVDFGGGEGGFVGARRGHEEGGLGGGDAGEEFGFGGVAGRDDGEGAFAVIEAQVGHAGGGVGAVATDALVRQEGEDVAAEVDRLGGEGSEEHKKKAAHDPHGAAQSALPEWWNPAKSCSIRS